MAHPRCVGWGEIGLDYHYDNSPRDVQQAVFIRQLKQAVKLGKPLTIHTREAEEDTERILKQEVPAEHKVCSLLFARDISHSSYLFRRSMSIVSQTHQVSQKSYWKFSPTFTSESQVFARLSHSALIV
jgi:Tat protein secretion system quality control protein TatD with DNase activity